ncbi:hypothetical protein [Cupriavidus plantarum]|uniref:hypothetical protein n=1 Tax=Cupriavidus plantarum TaxID=942865 RepID=UPI000EAC4FCE|nr:hypothetical protein [Cupriavidus plantarum]RLK35516.1 hypothetical protein C7417_3286 [Cupriavidus plantarum]
MKTHGRWRKLGRVFCPDGSSPWMRTHAAVPIAQSLGGDLFRVYFSARDANGRSHTGYVVIDITRPEVILARGEAPVLAPGELGAFDDSGAMATWLTPTSDGDRLYYIGWNLGVTVPFRNAIGLAVSRAPNSPVFERYAPGPIVDRTMSEPHFCASCCVLRDGAQWRMWYLSCTEWRTQASGPEHRYHIKYATSEDGVHWRRDGLVAIDYASDAEVAISRPSVVRDADVWRMWYSYRTHKYRIGYAESEDAVRWVRRDDASGIDVSDDGWDADMIEYPFVFDHAGRRYMLYNGNGYGATGFGVAVLD